MRFPRVLGSCAGRANAMRAGAVAVGTAALVAGGCSADVARFDFPGFSLADKGGTTASIPRPSEPMRNGASLGETAGPDGTGAYVPPRAARDPGSDVRVAALPEPAPAAPATVQPIASRNAPPTPPPAIAAAKGDTIEVQPGDTLYKLSKRHGVPVSELMSVNGLSGPNLKPGQKLNLPAGKTARRMVPKTPAAEMAYSPGNEAAPAQAAAPAARAAAPAAVANWDGSHTVKQGDSLYALSRQYKVPIDQLQQVNGITDPRKVRPGTVLKVPGSGGAAPQPPATVAAAPPAPSAQPVTAEPAAPPPRLGQTSTQPTILNGGEKKVAALTEKTNDAAPQADTRTDQVAAAGSSAAGATGKLRWPVRGKVISGFGPRPDGTHNDGVNISVPAGTEIHAAEAGTVAYAGSELKGYGNLILIRHDNGWVTAYAHNDELLVKRGDRIKRGQVVAKAGTSGQVDQPQLHFELRQASKPVDPTPFMEKM